MRTGIGVFWIAIFEVDQHRFCNQIYAALTADKTFVSNKCTTKFLLPMNTVSKINVFQYKWSGKDPFFYIGKPCDEICEALIFQIIV